MFFTRLRRRAKWVFAGLAAAFAIGFLAFGVGTGVQGGNIGDVLRDFFGGGGDESSLAEARSEALEKPNDAAAQLAYARALRAEGQTDEAAAQYEKVLAIAPETAAENGEALLSLASLYGQEGQGLLQLAELASSQAQNTLENQTLFDPNASQFQLELAENRLSTAISTGALAQAERIGEQAQAIFAKQQAVYAELVSRDPEDVNAQLSLAQAAQFAGDEGTALAAYLAALALDPESGRSELIKQQIRALGGQVPGEEPVATDEAAATETGAPAATGGETLTSP